MRRINNTGQTYQILIKLRPMTRFWGSYTLIFSVVFLALSASSISLAADPIKSFTLNLVTAYGATLDKENRQSSVSFTPEVDFQNDAHTRVKFSGLIDRPTSEYSSIKIPVISLVGIKELDADGDFNSQLALAFSALSVDKIGSEGLSLRTRPSISLFISPFDFLNLNGRMGPYLILSQYNQFSNGEPKPRYGINEQIAIEISIKKWRGSLTFILDQAHTSFWRNDYSSSQSLQYLFSSNVSLGVSHSLLSSVVDDSTGFYRAVQVFDSRNSRVSMFLDVTL